MWWWEVGNGWWNVGIVFSGFIGIISMGRAMVWEFYGLGIIVGILGIGVWTKWL